MVIVWFALAVFITWFGSSGVLITDSIMFLVAALEGNLYLEILVGDWIAAIGELVLSINRE